MEKEEVKAIVEDLKASDLDENVYFPWEDVFDSMMKNPDSVHYNTKVCPDCGTTLIQLHFSSPDWTWRSLCGRAGDMVVCPQCHTQAGFKLTIMN